MPKVRFKDFYEYADSFDERDERLHEEDSYRRTKPFFRDKKYHKRKLRCSSRKPRHEDAEDLY